MIKLRLKLVFFLTPVMIATVSSKGQGQIVSPEMQAEREAEEARKSPTEQYCDKVAHKIMLDCWRGEPETGKNGVVIAFDIQADGHLYALTVKKSSQIKTIDQAALAAIITAQPFLALPVKGKSIHFFIGFNEIFPSNPKLAQQPELGFRMNSDGSYTYSTNISHASTGSMRYY